MAKLTEGGKEMKDLVESGDINLDADYKRPFEQKHGRKTTLSDDDVCNFIFEKEHDEALDEPERVNAMLEWEQHVTTAAMAGKAA